MCCLIFKFGFFNFEFQNLHLCIYTKKNTRDRGSAGLYTVYILFLWSLNAKFQIPSLRRRVFAPEMLDLWKCTNTRALMSVLMTLRPPCWPVLQSSVSADTTLTYSLQPYLIQLFHKTLENFKQMFLLRQVTAWLRTGATFSSFILTSQDGAKVGKGDAHFTLSRSVYFEISRNAYSLQSAQIFLRCIFAAKYGTGGQGTRAFPLHLHICFCRTFAEWEA